jgi:hypothetical protein
LNSHSKRKADKKTSQKPTNVSLTTKKNNFASRFMGSKSSKNCKTKMGLTNCRADIIYHFNTKISTLVEPIIDCTIYVCIVCLYSVSLQNMGNKFSFCRSSKNEQHHSRFLFPDHHFSRVSEKEKKLSSTFFMLTKNIKLCVFFCRLKIMVEKCHMHVCT